MIFGTYTIDTVRSGDFRLDGGAMFGVVPKNLWSRTTPADDQNRIAMTMRTLVLRDGERTILIDTGVGHKESDKFTAIFAIDFSAHALTAELAALGITPESVTDVILTHLHFDHAGGSMMRGPGGLQLVFPHAMHYVQRRQWEWANAPTERDRASYFPDNYVPLMDAGKLTLLDGPEQLFPGISVDVINGHTFGQQIVRIDDGNGPIVYCADLIPMAAHIPAPYIMGYDLQPLVTLEEKHRVLDDAASSRAILVFEHDPGTEAAIVARDDRGVRATATGTLESVLAARN